MGKAEKLSEKERRFVEAYMGKAAGNGTQAARLAGYKGSDETLAVRASQLIRKSNVSAAVEKRIESDPLVATREERQRFWTAAMRGELEDFKPADQLKASELLGKAQIDFPQKTELTGKNGAPLIPTVITFALDNANSDGDEAE